MEMAGASVAGYYECGGPSSFQGLSSGSRLEISYREPAAIGEAKFELAPGGESFEGQWCAEGGTEWKPWTGTRVHADPGVTWLVVFEAHWQRSLAENEYAFGHMLREVFARRPGVQVRQRFFQDAESLEHWCRELLYLPEPAILVIASHGEAEGPSVHGRVIDTDRILESLEPAASLKLLHFSCCLVGSGEIPSRRFPVSGYTTRVDWGVSALLEFSYLDLILNRGLGPAEAAEKLPLLVRFAGDVAPPGSPYPAAGFRFFPAK
jgi:hypothetical protein